jgi:aspartate/methionine/tyrosine aminotransferase
LPCNPAIAAVGGSVIRELNARKKNSSVDLGLGEPTLAPNLAHFEAAVRWIAAHGCKYTASNAGDTALRSAIAAHYGYVGMSDANNVCVTTGSQEAIYVVLKTLLDPACDELLLIEPTFTAYEKIARIEGIAVRRATMLAETDFAFDANRILQAVTPRTRAVLICSPCNPTGRVISRADVATISRALGRLPGPPVYVIHDEIYREIRYTDDMGSFGEVYPYTIAVNALSKSNALTGLRIGWIMGHREPMAQMVKMHALTTSCASTFGQRVAYELFAANELGAHRAWYERQRDEAVQAARAAGLRMVEPEGAFYLCVRPQGGEVDDLAFARALLEESDVVTTPASIFASTLRGWLRTSFVGSSDALRAGYARIGASSFKGHR